ncbi:putative secretion system X transmembrane protein 2 (plasmid) [Paraburkholderia caribensis MBA4]|uniref:Putative secretion system X transmembrane protein 2 n=1 Tax=Paraburkholderia caribensis MBA4 TaxID=1323664 RepID=A0A0N7JW44_9BURK|nr:hypothetical protein [Paraburkholderia caribensis]ALL70981.1 putative secretion system X transmembrane protein 2 [Paraburkholderia caribensis MBA4]
MNVEFLRERCLTLRFEWMRRFGVAGLAGIALLCAAAVVADSAARMQSDTLALSNEVRPASAAKKADVARDARSYADAAVLASLPDLFPRFAHSADDIAAILAHAHDSNLAVGSAEYVVVADPGGRYVRYQMLLPVKDQYVTIRRFLASVLNSVPNAALREIHVERPAVDGSVLDARVRFELVYGTARP